MRTRRTRLFTVLLGIMAILLAACGGGNPAGVGEGGDGGGDDIQVGVAFDIGGRGDQSFNDAAFRGLQNAIDDGLVPQENTEFIEPNASGSNRDENVVTFADQGYDLVLAIGFAFSPGIDEIASDYPDTKFAVVDGFAKERKNVTNLTFKEHEGSFLVGAAAGLKTKVNTVGFLGGQQGTGLIERFEAGYVAGVEEVKPNVEVLVEYIGDSTAAFNDPTRGEALSDKMYDAGADVIYHAAGASGAGLFKSSAAHQQYSIGVDSDQSLTASPEQRKWILTSMLKRVDVAVYDTIKQVSRGEFTSGTQVFGLKEDGVGYAVNKYNDNERLLSQDIQAKLEELKTAIVGGEITVPAEP